MNQLIPLLIGSSAVAAVTAYGLTWLARMVAPALGFVDQPDGGRKQHGNPMPLLGGAAIFVAFGVTLAIFLACGPRHWLQGSSLDLAVMLASGGLFCLLGLWDDKYPLRARDKLLLQILASLPFAMWGQEVEVINVVGFRFELGLWSLLFSVFWLVSCANVVNLVDGLDGLASSIGLIAISALAVMSVIGLAPFAAFVALTFAGSVAGFLFHNWPPARIFLGDAGSLTIGFMVGAIAIESSNKTTVGFVLIFPLVLLGIPIFDTAMAILRRKLTGRGIGEADRGHIHHRLQERGLTKLQTLLAIIAICSVMALACLAAVNVGQDLIAMALGVGVISIIVAGRVFGFHEMMLVFRHFEIFHVAVSAALREMTGRRVVVHLEHAESVSVDSLWEAVVARVESIGGMTLEMACTVGQDRETVLEKLWSSDARTNQKLDTWQLRRTLVRGDGLRTSFLVLGHQNPNTRAQSLDQISNVLEACNHRLPAVDELRSSSVDAVSLPLRIATCMATSGEHVLDRRRAA